MGQLVDIQAPVGMDPENDDCRLIAHATLIKGEVVAVDRTVTTFDGAAVGATNNLNIFTKTRQATAADVANGILVVALADVTSGGVGTFRVSGICDVKVSANVAANAQTIFKTAADANFWAVAGTPVTDASGTVKIFAISCNGVAVTATAAHAASGLCPCWVNGINGFTSSST